MQERKKKMKVRRVSKKSEEERKGCGGRERWGGR